MNRNKIVSIVLGTLLASTLFGQQRVTTQITLQGKKIFIEYGQTLLRGRDMLAKAKSGMVWRMGTNEASSIQTESNLHFGDTVIPKGSYSLFAKCLETDHWQLLFNSETGIWGTSHDPGKDVAAIPLETNHLDGPVEELTIRLEKAGADSAVFSMSWGKRELTAAFKIN